MIIVFGEERERKKKWEWETSDHRGFYTNNQIVFRLPRPFLSTLKQNLFHIAIATEPNIDRISFLAICYRSQF